ncbi:hypothetical protein [Roseovarius sp. SYSU LYC5161]|uniref:hypothetical protein n=1 Tax=Roseovarius halophilus (ex Wu et al. 2025) TaxID=3376060 RepID=UPI00399A09A0
MVTVHAALGSAVTVIELSGQIAPGAVAVLHPGLEVHPAVSETVAFAAERAPGTLSDL